MLDKYITIIDESKNEIIEKKSKFIGSLFHIENECDAIKKIKEIKKKYYDAKHNVFAYVIYEENRIIEKYSDDGEPNGTAGKPILEMLKQKEIYNVLIVVTRYFGGILLGTGGLLRAYNECTKGCIDKSLFCEMVYSNILEIKVNYDEINIIKYYCELNNYNISNIEYLDNIILNIIVEDNKFIKICEDIKNILNRNVDIKIIKKQFERK